MDPKDRVNSQPIKELEWLASFFINHGRNDLAKKIFEEVKGLQSRMKGGPNKTFNQDEPNSPTSQNSSGEMT
ncbi:MAG: hypothetical protein KIT34_02635 [Cyanobacteria bacterium TGS_CYA1]|nr:hypothetical protein [Cyanobacteria bacterium TGS_CYA1]